MKPQIIESDSEFLTKEQITGMGELCFLYMRARNFQNGSVSLLRAALEPAIHTGHFAVMRQDSMPRAAISWAFLDPEAEARFIAGQPLGSEDWMSGDRVWLMDIVAPYGQDSGRRMVRHFEGLLKPEVGEYRALRTSQRQGTRRQYLCRRLPSGRFGSVVDMLKSRETTAKK